VEFPRISDIKQSGRVGLGPSYGLTLTILVAEPQPDPDYEEENEEEDLENMLPSDRWRQPRKD